MSVISDIKMILESNSIHLLYDARLCTEQKERWDAIKDADLVEVVRCKDCIHYYHDSLFACERCGKTLEKIKLNGYCNYGERRK